jgi:hypothetical protein
MTEFLMTHRIPESLTPLGEWLAEVADNVTLITDQHAFPSYHEIFPDVYAVPGYAENSAVEVLLQEVCRQRPITTLIHVTEDDILRCARVRDQFGISGLRYAQALAWRDKYEMKRLLTGHVPVPAHTLPSGAAHALDFARSTGYPVVVKPRAGFASRGVTIVPDAAELTRLAASWDPDDVLLEAFEAGPVFHIDGFTSGQELLYLSVSRYINDCLSFQEALPLGSVQLDRDSEEFSRAEAFTAKVLRALPPAGFCPFHLEVFQRPDGEFAFCEIACRLGGAHVVQALTYATGVNPARLWVRDQAGLADGPQTARRLSDNDGRYGWLLIPPHAGRLLEVRNPPSLPFIKDFYVNTTAPREFTGATGSVDSIMSFVVHGQDSADLTRNVLHCARLAAGLARWEAVTPIQHHDNEPIPAT